MLGQSRRSSQSVHRLGSRARLHPAIVRLSLSPVRWLASSRRPRLLAHPGRLAHGVRDSALSTAIPAVPPRARARSPDVAVAVERVPSVSRPSLTAHQMSPVRSGVSDEQFAVACSTYGTMNHRTNDRNHRTDPSASSNNYVTCTDLPCCRRVNPRSRANVPRPGFLGRRRRLMTPKSLSLRIDFPLSRLYFFSLSFRGLNMYLSRFKLNLNVYIWTEQL